MPQLNQASAEALQLEKVRRKVPDSRAQVRLAHAVRGGYSNKMPREVADEIVSEMHGRKMSSLPARKKKKNNPHGKMRKIAGY